MKSSLSFKRNTTDKLSIKGTLSDDCSTITYTDENGDEKEIFVVDLLNAMKNQHITWSISIFSYLYTNFSYSIYFISFINSHNRKQNIIF